MAMILRTRETGRYHIVSCPVCQTKLYLNLNQGAHMPRVGGCEHIKEVWTIEDLRKFSDIVNFCLVSYTVPDDLIPHRDKILTVQELIALYDEFEKEVT